MQLFAVAHDNDATVPPGRGLATVDHRLPFQRSATVPAARQLFVLTHETELIGPLAVEAPPDDHFLPFQRSTESGERPLPTAKHCVGPVHDTGSIVKSIGTTDQRLPSHFPANGPWPPPPTATHCVVLLHDTLFSTASPPLRGWGAATIDHAV